MRLPEPDARRQKSRTVNGVVCLQMNGKVRQKLIEVGADADQARHIPVKPPVTGIHTRRGLRRNEKKAEEDSRDDHRRRGRTHPKTKGRKKRPPDKPQLLPASALHCKGRGKADESPHGGQQDPQMVIRTVDPVFCEQKGGVQKRQDARPAPAEGKNADPSERRGGEDPDRRVVVGRHAFDGHSHRHSAEVVQWHRRQLQPPHRRRTPADEAPGGKIIRVRPAGRAQAARLPRLLGVDHPLHAVGVRNQAPAVRRERRIGSQRGKALLIHLHAVNFRKAKDQHKEESGKVRGYVRADPGPETVHQLAERRAGFLLNSPLLPVFRG